AGCVCTDVSQTETETFNSRPLLILIARSPRLPGRRSGACSSAKEPRPYSPDERTVSHSSHAATTTYCRPPAPRVRDAYSAIATHLAAVRGARPRTTHSHGRAPRRVAGL